jgi:hypothetical protein
MSSSCREATAMLRNSGRALSPVRWIRRRACPNRLRVVSREHEGEDCVWSILFTSREEGQTSSCDLQARAYRTRDLRCAGFRMLSFAFASSIPVDDRLMPACTGFVSEGEVCITLVKLLVPKWTGCAKIPAYEIGTLKSALDLLRLSYPPSFTPLFVSFNKVEPVTLQLHLRA